MQSILIDAGPIIALFNKRDQYHMQIIKFLEKQNCNLWTTWPVITEASHMLDFSIKAQLNLLEWIKRGGLNLVSQNAESIDQLISFTKKYSDVPMDLADASLMVAAESLSVDKIISIDSDFYIYKNIRNKYLKNIFFENLT